MAYQLTWLAQTLRDAGCRVVEVDGWQDRGHGDVGKIAGVLCHHTAGPRNGDAPSLIVVKSGRPGLDGPCANLFLSRSGVFYVVAAGCAWHAGAGEYRGVVNGNHQLIGIEAENTGLDNDQPWPVIQTDAYALGVAAILKRIGARPEMCAGHKEYAPRRKIDPTFDMDQFRAKVAANMAVLGAPVAPLPTIRLGDKGSAVAQAQQLLQIPADGIFGPKTEAAARAFQQIKGLGVDGIIGPATWATLQKAS